MKAHGIDYPLRNGIFPHSSNSLLLNVGTKGFVASPISECKQMRSHKHYSKKEKQFQGTQEGAGLL
jgi:hypothetical protein